jgi:hypothetical protein
LNMRMGDAVRFEMLVKMWDVIVFLFHQQ